MTSIDDAYSAAMDALTKLANEGHARSTEHLHALDGCRARIAELEDLLLEEQQVRHLHGTQLAECTAAAAEVVHLLVDAGVLDNGKGWRDVAPKIRELIALVERDPNQWVWVVEWAPLKLGGAK